MTTRRDEEEEAPRSMTVILGEMRDVDEEGNPSGPSALEELTERFHAFTRTLREESFARDATVTGEFTFALKMSAHKSNATVSRRIDTKLPKPPQAAATPMFTTKGGNLVAEKPSQTKMKFRDVNEPAEKTAGTKGI